MSEVSARAEHLIRAAVKGITGNPDTWNQRNWVMTPEDFRAANQSVPACGTTYCLGGWMMLYDGWKHRRGSYPQFRNTWVKDDRVLHDPFVDHLRTLIGPYEDFDDISGTIFSTFIGTIPALIAKIEKDLEINFEEDCPCLTEEDACILAGCPCGVHTNLEVKAVIDTSSGDAMTRIINTMVVDCAKAGDPISVTQITNDPILMKALRAMFLAGEDSMVSTVTKKANRRLQEVRIELAEMTRSRDRVIQANSMLQQAKDPVDLKRQLDDVVEAQKLRAETIRKLQGQINDLKSGARQDPDVVKIKKKHEAATAHVHGLTLNNEELAKEVDRLRRELTAQKQVVVQLQDQIISARKEGAKVAIASWQKALDLIKTQENL